MTHSASDTFEHGMHGGSHRRGCGKGIKTPWSVWEIGAMVAGFVMFWPLGLLALFLKWKNGEMWRGSAGTEAPWTGFRKPDFKAWQQRYRSTGFGQSGNAAFDDYKRAELEKLDAQRRKLEEDQRAFGDFVERVRRAKDQDEFDRFMAERNAPPPAPQ